MIPFDGNIDWVKIADYLARYGKDCAVMLEIKKSNHKMYDDMPLREYYKRVANALKKLNSMIGKRL